MGLLDKLFGAFKKENTVSLTVDETDFFEDWSYKRSREELIAELKDMIERNFPEYDVIYDYPAFDLNPYCHPASTPVQFMFQKAGKNVLAVVVVKQNTYRGMNVKATQNFCEELGIPYIRFFEEYPNKEEYVVPRIKSYL